MSKQRLEEQATQSEIVTRIDFPRPILEAELDDLMRYIIRNMPTKDMHITTTKTKKYGSYGRGYGGLDQNMTDVPVSEGDLKITGYMTESPVSSASFTIRREFDGLERNVLTGIDFNITPGYEAGELHSDCIKLMKSMARHTEEFFKLAREV